MRLQRIQHRPVSRRPRERRHVEDVEIIKREGNLWRFTLGGRPAVTLQPCAGSHHESQFQELSSFHASRPECVLIKDDAIAFNCAACLPSCNPINASHW